MKKTSFYLLLILLTAINVGPGCQKSKPSNPCEGVVNEGTPAMAGLILIDGQSGENILLSKNIDSSTITISQEGTNGPSEPGQIVKTTGSPMHGALVFHIADTKEGAFRYKISIPNIGTTTLSYTNKTEESDNPCKPHYISVTHPAIEDHSYTLSQTGSRLIFTVTL